MPSTSAKQAKFMLAVANSPKFAKKVGVPQSVGKDFEMADKKMKKFGDGGASSKPKPPMGSPEADDVLITTPRGKKLLEEQRRREAEREKADAAKRARADKLLGIGMKKGGTMMKATKAGRALVKKSADTMGRAMVKKAGGGKCYAKGGSVSSRADGCATKGKTDTKMVKMAMGGSPTDRAIGRMVAKQNAPAMMSSAPRPSNMGANMMRRKKGGKC